MGKEGRDCEVEREGEIVRWEEGEDCEVGREREGIVR